MDGFDFGLGTQSEAKSDAPSGLESSAANGDEKHPSIESIQLNAFLHTQQLDRLIYELNAGNRATRKMRISMSDLISYDVSPHNLPASCCLRKSRLQSVEKI